MRPAARIIVGSVRRGLLVARRGASVNIPAAATVSDLIAEFLVRCGVDTAFGVVSVHNIPMLDAISRTGSVRFVMARGEQGASHMADGYARAAKRLGVLFSSTGPGAANAVTGLVEARSASSPVLHLTGQVARQFIGRGAGVVHDTPAQLAVMRAAGKAAYRIEQPEHALDILRQAVAEALDHPSGPVSVEVPIDLQAMHAERPSWLDQFELSPSPPRAPTAGELDHLVGSVMGARRVLLWAGRGAAGAGREIAELLDLGFGLVTSLGGRGVVSEDHAMNLGALNGAGLEPVEEFYDSVDLMLVLGSRLRGYETADFKARLPKRIVQIDVDSAADCRTYGNVGFVHADVRLTLEALISRIRSQWRGDARFGEQFRRLRTFVRSAYKASLGPYADMPEQLRSAMPRTAIWARDITMNATTWGHRLLQIHDPSTNIYPTCGGIGQGLCLGIGASLSPGGRKTVVLIGDGGLALNLGELWTAVQEHADMTIIVANDRGYGVIKHIQDKVSGGRRIYADLLTPDHGQIAELAGMPFWRVSRAQDFEGIVRQALAIRGVSMVELDMTSIGAFPPYFPFGPPIKSAQAGGGK